MGRRKSWNRLRQAAHQEAEPLEEKRGALADLQWSAIFVLPFVLVLVALFLAALATGGFSSGPARAAIVDQLSLTAPNPTFAQSATETLEQAGYVVDYHPGEEVSVDFYRNLQTKGYELIVFRTHSARLVGEWRGDYYNHAVLWTSEPYVRSRYLEEQRELRVGSVSENEDDPRFFGIHPSFVASDMQGNFNGATIIMMGCNGLTTSKTAEAFLWRGAKAVVSWDGYVSSTHTDAVTDRLLKLLTIEGLETPEAVKRVRTEFGPDPSHGGQLRALVNEG